MMPGRRIIMKSVVVVCAALLVLAGLGYAGACAWFVMNERSFVFYPMARASTSPEEAGLDGVLQARIATEDGETLYGWWAPAQPGHGAIVYFIGKGLVLSDAAGLFGDLASHGFGVLGIDYRGNGLSTGHPSEAGLRADARAAFDFVRDAAPEARIAAFGESLGTGVAVGLAHDRPVAGVLLNSPYASIARLFELRGMKLPYRLLMADPLDSEALIGGLGVPVMILHSRADKAIPIAEARRLYAAAQEPKEMIELDGANHGEVWFGPTRDRALAALAAWTSQ
jgi:alpha-beta hydrolase superfamily lysophospholipase